ncbi:MAG: radical SAM family heme chaperone HemW [Melioribacter sp.]|nr:radical SAM family heme chaperone HemW [Melioribacter sp.]
MKETSIYIHVPFCEHKCIYCDFYSIITKDKIDEYIGSLKKEISFFADQYPNRKITSIYFGGGTPSLLDSKFIYEIISFIKSKFYLLPQLEITLEANPGTIDKAKLKSLLDIGVNRLSIGVQSFNDDELKFLTRIHDSKTAIKTVLDAYENGFENINIDLIFNLPGQTKELWKHNLITATRLPIKHISAYSLILERGTILYKMVLDGKVTLQDDDYDADLYETTIQFLKDNGFIQYEVSNFAKLGFECIHNSTYWRYKDYFGFGPSAHSFIDGERWWNYSSLYFYSQSINKKNNAIIGREKLTQEQKLNEYIMLSLRSWGLNIEEFEKIFGNNWLKKNEEFISKMVDYNLMTIKNNYIKLTEKGYPICDEIISKLI